MPSVLLGTYLEDCECEVGGVVCGSSDDIKAGVAKPYLEYYKLDKYRGVCRIEVEVRIRFEAVPGET